MEFHPQESMHIYQSHINSTKMKKVALLFVIFTATIVSCKKEDCHECHYEDASNNEVELGNYCGSDLENIEKNGYSDGTNTFDVHCHEH